MADIIIKGSLGFYSIYGHTEAGKSWVNRHVEGALHGSAYSDQTDMTQNIADAATDDGINVSVNDQPYTRTGR